MRISLVTHGTRGDIQPFMLLAVGLLRAGHEVTLAANSGFEQAIAELGIPYVPLAGDFNAFLRSPELLEMNRKGDELGWRRVLAKFWLDVRRDLWPTLDPLFASSSLVLFNAHSTYKDCSSFGERYGSQLMPVCFAPAFPHSSEFPNIYVTTRRMPLKVMNRFAHRHYDRFYWSQNHTYVNDLRQRLGLKPLHGPIYRYMDRFPVLHCYSRHLFEKPSDWGDEQALVGPLLLSHAAVHQDREAPPAGLVQWLDSGSPPIFLGLGTQVLPHSTTVAVMNMLPQLSAELGVRFVVHTGWSALELLPSTNQAFFVKNIDHEWMFPRCQAVLHHGGMSTTAVCALAGVPQIVCSLFADQPFWGTRVSALRVGVHVRAQRLTVSRLGAALRKVQASEMRQRCQQLAHAMRTENGYEAALATIGRWIRRIEAQPARTQGVRLSSEARPYSPSLVLDH